MNTTNPAYVPDEKITPRPACATPPPECPLRPESRGLIPDEQACVALWDKYEMPDHIRAHSRMVAHVAVWLAERALKKGIHVNIPEVRASALLHDLAKPYTIHHGGNHGHLGGAWVLEETGNPLIAHGVLHHIHWPWEINVRQHYLPMAVIYGDKRVQHDTLVTVKQRYEDLILRYGSTDYIINRIRISEQQGYAIEQALEKELGVELKCESF